MKTKKSDLKTKAKVKIKSLKLAKETIETLSDQETAKVKGGATSNFYTGGQCWVARAVYGEDNPRWIALPRLAHVGCPAWFRSLYLRHGERFALWLAPHAALKAVIRLWMDSRIDSKTVAVTQPS